MPSAPCALILTLLSFGGFSARAELVEVAPIEVAHGLPAWNELVLGHAKAVAPVSYRECAEVKEIPGAFLCANGGQRGMAAGMARASAFIEGIGSEITGSQAITKGRIFETNAPELRAYAVSIGGYDLKGEDLATFYQALQKACVDSKNDPFVCPTDAEKEIFESFILPHLQKSPAFVVITYPLTGSNSSPSEVVSHEIMHAQYFLQPAFRQLADRFWSEQLNDEQRAKVREELGLYYDQTDELLMRNEFQAYMLMNGAMGSVMGDLAGLYRDPLMKMMTDHGVNPLQVD